MMKTRTALLALGCAVTLAGPAQAVPNRPMQAELDLCAPLRFLEPGAVEFRFAQLLEPAGVMSPDSHVDLSLRPESSPLLRRYRIDIGVENAGARDFRANRRCPVLVRLRTYEGPDGSAGGRGGWSPPREEDVGDIAVNAVLPLRFEGSFLGTGNQPPGGWDLAWDYTLIELSLDTPNRVRERAETDNRIVHCYHAPSQSFAPLSACGGDRPDP